jgi:NAD(P)-dependent dehydrogenase (short-subunit alcohol dehydrogenase family)
MMRSNGMREFMGKVAVVTGGASGIGFGLAERFAQEGMRVVVADVEQPALEEAVADLRERGHDVLGVQTDVRKAESVEELAKRAVDTYGKVHIVCNNAGVTTIGGSAANPATWEFSLRDWDWVLGVNLMGVVHGVRAFLPIMLQQNEEGHVVNTGSINGLVTVSGAPYGVSKFGVVRLTEGLYLELKARGAKIGCSVLCPGGVATRIGAADRNRPTELRDPDTPVLPEEEQRERRTAAIARWSRGMPPQQLAQVVLDAIREEQFYILPHPGVLDGVRMRMDDLLAQLNPRPPVFQIS